MILTITYCSKIILKWLLMLESQILLLFSLLFTIINFTPHHYSLHNNIILQQKSYTIAKFQWYTWLFLYDYCWIYYNNINGHLTVIKKRTRLKVFHLENFSNRGCLNVRVFVPEKRHKFKTKFIIKKVSIQIMAQQKQRYSSIKVKIKVSSIDYF